MLQSFFEGFNMPEHHGSRGSEIHDMCLLHDFQPFSGSAFYGGNLAADPIGQYLSPGPRQAVHSRCHKLFKHFTVGEVFNLRQVDDLRGAKCMQPECGIEFL